MLCEAVMKEEIHHVESYLELPRSVSRHLPLKSVSENHVI